MKAFLASLLVMSFSFATVASAQNDITFSVEKVKTPAAAIAKLHAAQLKKEQQDQLYQVQADLSLDGEGAVDINTIVNYGVKLWQVVKANEPVVNQSHMYANALPSGLKGAYDLESSSPYQYSSYRFSAKNYWGFTVYDVVVTMAHQYGGSYEGAGKYIASASIIPTDVHVLWGYTVDLSVKEISVTNIGKKDDPVASLGLELNFHVSTPLKKSTYRRLVEFLGNSPKARMIR